MFAPGFRVRLGSENLDMSAPNDSICGNASAFLEAFRGKGESQLCIGLPEEVGRAVSEITKALLAMPQFIFHFLALS